MSNKTLIGKEGYLFLHNDSSLEIEKHCNPRYTCNTIVLNTIAHIKNYILIVFPDKSYTLRQFLPDTIIPIHRPAFDQYAKVLGNRIVDGYAVIENTHEVFYKTDTHMNLKGVLLVLNAAIQQLNIVFGCTIDPFTISLHRAEVNSLSPLQVGIGDLTWSPNLGNQTLESCHDIYYSTDTYTHIYKTIIGGYVTLLSSTLQDCTHMHATMYFTWDTLSEYIIYRNNPHKKYKVLVFYDSFTVPVLPLLIGMFNEIYLAKQIFNKDLVDKINPTYVLEFRVERFLS